MNNLYFLIISFIYLILVMIIYFSKKKINTSENKVYSILLTVTLLGVVIDFSSVYMAFSGLHNSFFGFVNRLYLVYLLTWISLLTSYSFIISLSKKAAKKGTSFIKIIYIPMAIFLLFYPLAYTVEGNEFFTHGLSANAMYGLSTIYVIVMIICLLSNIKNLKQKKYVPIIFYIFIGTFITLIQLFNPSILIITAMEAFVTILMYFTIENPDLKMIEELNIARDQADKANNAKSEFLSNMSHEIRTPLNAIVGFSQALEEENLPDEAKDEVKDIIMASQSLLEIVNGILDISKIEANKLEIVNAEYDFNKVLEELVALTRARMGDKPLQFKTSFDPTIPTVLYGDHTRIKQIILNLLTNAVKYTKEGYINFKVDSVIKEDVCRLIISVEDSGIGIKEENINKLFSKFERFDLEKNITIEGTGLGLAITKKLVDLMNGKIVVQSTYGEGSRFTVAIDQKIVKTPTITIKDQNEQKEVKAFDVSGKRILVVDDNKLNLKVAARLLKEYNVEIETIDSGFECIEKIKAGQTYDLILMDDMMPKMTGTETIAKLKQIEGYNIPTIALTANAISGMKEKYMKAGFDGYLSKPIDKLELNRIINDFLNK
jgi:signal transduction histidine kinase/CheY-like chemotaxis protein